MKPIIVIVNNELAKMFDGDKINDARLYAQNNNGVIYRREDWYQYQKTKAAKWREIAIEESNPIKYQI